MTDLIISISNSWSDRAGQKIGIEDADILFGEGRNLSPLQMSSWRFTVSP